MIFLLIPGVNGQIMLIQHLQLVFIPGFFLTDY
jgi:hypothetical protein